MKFAVVKTGGKQYKVSEGDILDIERVESPDKKITFENVLLFADGDTLEVGKPLTQGVVVGASVLEDIKGPKIRVAKYKAKVRYRRVRGHRQALTRVKIESISKGSKPAKKETAPKARSVAAKSKS